VAARSEAWNVFARWNIWIVDSNPTRGRDICLRFFCVGSGLATGLMTRPMTTDCPQIHITCDGRQARGYGASVHPKHPAISKQQEILKGVNSPRRNQYLITFCMKFSTHSTIVTSIKVKEFYEQVVDVLCSSNRISAVSSFLFQHYIMYHFPKPNQWYQWMIFQC
jgi:hypothetical protein